MCNGDVVMMSLFTVRTLMILPILRISQHCDEHIFAILQMLLSIKVNFIWLLSRCLLSMDLKKRKFRPRVKHHTRPLQTTLARPGALEQNYLQFMPFFPAERHDVPLSTEGEKYKKVRAVPETAANIYLESEGATGGVFKNTTQAASRWRREAEANGLCIYAQVFQAINRLFFCTF